MNRRNATRPHRPPRSIALAAALSVLPNLPAGAAVQPGPPPG